MEILGFMSGFAGGIILGAVLIVNGSDTATIIETEHGLYTQFEGVMYKLERFEGD